MAEDTDIKRLFLVVRDRSRIQDIALELLALLKGRGDQSGVREAGSDPYALLVGVTFSLWRAIFLADIEIPNRDDVLVRAESFLEKVIRDNAIGYVDDWNNRQWSFTYYLNNARYRLKEFALLVPEFAARLDGLRSLGAVSQPLVEPEPFHSWNAHCEALREAISALRERNRPEHCE